MAKQAKCDNCGHDARLGSMGEAPAGWVEAIERMPPMDFNREYLACSPLCMGALMAKRAEVLNPPPSERCPGREHGSHHYARPGATCTYCHQPHQDADRG